MCSKRAKALPLGPLKSVHVLRDRAMACRDEAGVKEYVPQQENRLLVRSVSIAQLYITLEVSFRTEKELATVICCIKLQGTDHYFYCPERVSAK